MASDTRRSFKKINVSKKTEEKWEGEDSDGVRELKGKRWRRKANDRGDRAFIMKDLQRTWSQIVVAVSHSSGVVISISRGRSFSCHVCG
jgi:hypothetical protein